MFQLTNVEWTSIHSQLMNFENENNLWSQIATAKRRTLPFVFTEQGVAMLSAVFKSETAVNISIEIMDAFIKMRHTITANSLVNLRLEKVETKQLETDQKFEMVF
jgi:hypothetical protein